MRIGITIATEPGTGIARYTRAIMAQFAKARREGRQPTEIRAFAPLMRTGRPGWLPKELLYVSTRIPGRIQRQLLYTLGLSVERLYDLRDMELLHTTEPVPLRSRGPVVVTVYDVAWRQMGAAYLSITDQRWIENAERAIRASDHICAISRATADELTRTGVSPKKVTVTHLGVDQRFRGVTQDRVEEVRLRYNLPNAFVLYVGAINVRKNIAVVAQALESIRSAPPLVIAGPPPSVPLKTLGLDRIELRHLGYVPDEDIPCLLRAATMFVFPSIVEGFGLPLLEAMAVGVPTIASAISAFIEIGGDAPKYFAPTDVAELARGIQLIMSSESLRVEMVERGQARSRTFSWEKCYDATLSAYRAAMRR